MRDRFITRILKGDKAKAELAGSINDTGIEYAQKGEISHSLESFRQSMEKYDEIGDKLLVARVLNNTGLAHANKGDLDHALEYCNRSLGMIKESDDQQLWSALQANLGLIYMNRGDFSSSLEYTHRSLAKFEKLGSKYGMATCLNNIGAIYELKGEVDSAMETYTKSLTLFEEIIDIRGRAVSLNNLGNIYRRRGDLYNALSCYKKSLKLLEDAPSLIGEATTLMNLVALDVFSDSMESASQNLQKLAYLQEITDVENNKIIDQTYDFAKAIVLKKSERMVKRAEAQRIFQRIADGGVIQHEYLISAKMNVCDLLIQELRSSGSEEILGEIKALLEDLHEIAQNQQSSSLIVEIYLMQSKIALLELDIESARRILSQAHQIAEEKGLHSLSVVVSNEYDGLLEQQEGIMELKESKTTLSERLEITQLESMVSQIIRKKVEAPDLPEEIPVVLLILAVSGMSVFSKQFISEERLEDQLIGGFLTAINAVAANVLSESGSLEGIRHGDYTLLMKPVESLLACYVFKGHSYFATQKLRKFGESLKRSKATLKLLSNAGDFGRDVSGDAQVEELVTEAFLTSPDLLLDTSSYSSLSHGITATIKQGIYLHSTNL